MEAIIIDDTYGFESKPRVYNDVAPTLRSERSGLKIVESNIIAIRGRKSNLSIVSEYQQRIEVNKKGVSNTLTSVHKDNLVVEFYENDNSGEKTNYRIRKLTPRECFRLMDVSEPDIDKLLNAGISNSQLYKLAGNSIVVSCIYHIFRKMFIETQNENQQLTLFG